jgi:CBS domain-containing protein/sporulation protein YlmC with PRC-barrel domain
MEGGIEVLRNLSNKGFLIEDAQDFFMSGILGKKIYDKYGHTVGRVRDLVAFWRSGYPEVTGIKFTHSTQIIPIDRVAEFGLNGIFLVDRPRLTMVRPIADEEIFVNRWLLDKQVVDTKGAKVVRVNDIKLHLQQTDDEITIHLVAVDIGLRGLIRRMGLQYWCKYFPEQLLDWQHFKPLETRTANLTLSLSQEDLGHLHPADIADILEDLNQHEQANLLRSLDLETAAETLAEVDPGTRTKLLRNMDSTMVSALVQAMGPDEAADVLGDLSQEQSTEILDLMEPEDAQEVRELMEYPQGTAGSLMTTELVTLPITLTAQQAIDQMRGMAPAAETIYYVYVVDDSERLMGVLSLRELIVAPPETPLEELLNRNLVTLNPLDDFEKVLEATLKYDFLALPVVDESGILEGIITVDDVLGTLFSGRDSRKNLEQFSYLMFKRSINRR